MHVERWMLISWTFNIFHYLNCLYFQFFLIEPHLSLSKCDHESLFQYKVSSSISKLLMQKKTLPNSRVTNWPPIAIVKYIYIYGTWIYLHTFLSTMRKRKHTLLWIISSKIFTNIYSSLMYSNHQKKASAFETAAKTIIEMDASLKFKKSKLVSRIWMSETKSSRMRVLLRALKTGQCFKFKVTSVVL